MFKDTALMRLVIEKLAKKYHWTYDEAIHRFYLSDTCRIISNRATGAFTFSHMEIIEFFDSGYTIPR